MEGGLNIYFYIQFCRVSYGALDELTVTPGKSETIITGKLMHKYIYTTIKGCYAHVMYSLPKLT